MSKRSEMMGYATKDGINFLIHSLRILSSAEAFVPIPPNNFAKLYNKDEDLDTDALLSTLSELFPKENWDGYKPMNWKIEKHEAKYGVPESYIVKENNIGRLIPIHLTKDEAVHHQKLNQGIHKSEPANPYDYASIHTESFVNVYEKHIAGLDRNVLKLMGEIWSSQNRSLRKVLEPYRFNFNLRIREPLREFYIYEDMEGRCMPILPAFPSKMHKAMMIVKSILNDPAFSIIEDDLYTTEFLEERQYQKQADEVKAELDEKVNSIRKNIGLL